MEQILFNNKNESAAKSRILLQIKHRENQKLLSEYLATDYQIIASYSKLKKDGSADLMIIDQAALKDNFKLIKKVKFNRENGYLPLILLSKIDSTNICENCLNLIDEIIMLPTKKRILKSRIKKLLEIRKLFLSTKIYYTLIEENPLGIGIIEKNKFKYVNNSFLDILELNKQEILRKKTTKIFTNQKIRDRLEKKEKSAAELRNFEIKINEKNKWLNLKHKEINYQNKFFELLIIMDITKQREYEEKIKFLSFHDKLTDLYNRNYFMEELKRLDSSRQLPLSIIMGDVNSLKLINDAFGHKKGDELLIKTAEILKTNLRQEDILARIGGDEFSILLPNTDNKTANKIIKRIKNSCQKNDAELIKISIALGSATKTKADEDINEIFKKADAEMYANKTNNNTSEKINFVDNLKEKLFKNTQETKAHNQRMENMALDFAERLKLNAEQKRKLKLLIEFHDIGKVTLNSNILNKNEKLTENEFDLIKTHSDAGYRIIKNIPEISAIAEEILHHHEKWDGSGYPAGLKGEEIPLLSRILLLVEAYDVMTWGRNYKKKMSSKEAIKEIIRCAGKDFDPKLVKILNNIILKEVD